jgi:hypothetical protein
VLLYYTALACGEAAGADADEEGSLAGSLLLLVARAICASQRFGTSESSQAPEAMVVGIVVPRMEGALQNTVRDVSMMGRCSVSRTGPSAKNVATCSVLDGES